MIDPFDEKMGLKVPSFSADIVLVTHGHGDHNNISAIKGEPFLIENPGEYEDPGGYGIEHRCPWAAPSSLVN